MKYKRIVIPIYEQAVHFIIESNRGAVLEKLKHQCLYLKNKDKKALLCKNSVGMACELFHDGEFDSFLMWLPKFASTPGDWGIAAHEICHIKNYLWQYIGLKNQVPTKVDEVEAYLIGWLTENFVKFSRS